MSVSKAVPNRVTIIRYGTRQTRKSEVFLNNHVYGQPDGPVDMDYFVWLIEGPEGPVLVDTGFSEEGGRRRGRSMLIDPLVAIEKLGIASDALALAVLTHAHYDHIGNCARLPRTCFAMARAEYEFWTGPMASREQFHASIEDEEIDVLRKASDDGRLELVESEQEIAPGVTMHVVGGHTPGQAMVTVETSEGTVLLTSDAVHYADEVHLDRPFSIVADLPGMYAAFDHIRAMVREGEASHVVFGHDPGTLATVKGERPELPGLTASIGVL